MALPYTSLIESLENEVQKGTFTAWSCANAEGTWAAFFADEACPPDWVLDNSTENDQDNSASNQPLRAWFPAFDLASLSKPLLANAWFRHALDNETLLYNQTPLAGLLQPRSEEGVLLRQWAEARPWLTLAHLLNHTSGLPAWCWFGRALWQFPNERNPAEKNHNGRATGRILDLSRDANGEIARMAQQELTRHILSRGPLESDGSTTYSDLNYYLLARVVEHLGLHEFRGWQGTLDSLNGLWDTQFWHASLDPERSQIAIPFFPYVNSQVVAHVYEQRKLDNHAGNFGSVHDTNANILSSEFRSAHQTSPFVSSHAGLFGNIVDVARSASFFIESQQQFHEQRHSPTGNSTRFSWGLDTPSTAQSTAGLKTWPLTDDKKIFGHLGYTGTSLWMASDGQFHVLLTNRTAQRRTLGAPSVPRILFFQKDGHRPGASVNELECWVRFPSRGSSHRQNQSNSWQSLPWRDAYTLCFEQFRLVTRYWDRHTLRTPPDLAKIRREVGQILWSH
ncbi:hypothetical protein EBU99_04040 [bacterium]|nr:hypothetical protein [bacterium]